MKKLLKVIVLLSAALVAILAVVLIALFRFVQIGELRRFLVSEIERQTRLRVSVGEAELEMSRPRRPSCGWRCCRSWSAAWSLTRSVFFVRQCGSSGTSREGPRCPAYWRISPLRSRAKIDSRWTCAKSRLRRGRCFLSGNGRGQEPQ
ncbi:MAG: hypothetical protein HYU47_06795 [Deltaproteobacteria bacterium]|nr:hypothetical protein [Deltaproteobacteria bacterium]